MAKSVSFGSLVDPEQEKIERNRALAEALRGESMTPLNTQVAPGGLAVPITGMQGVSKIVQALLAKKMSNDTDQQAKDYGDKKRSQAASEMQAIISALKGSPERASFPTGANEMGDESVMQNPVPAVPGDPNRAMTMAMGSENPAMQQVGAQLLARQLEPKKPIVLGKSLIDPDTNKVIATDATWEEEKKLERERKAEELRVKTEDARLSRQERLDAQKELQRLNAESRADMVRLAASLRPAPPPVQPQIVTTPEGVFQVGRDGTTNPLKTPEGAPLSGKPVQPPGKALPTSAAGKLMENNQNLRRAEQALMLMEGKDVGGAKGDPDATGWKGYVPDAILQRTDKKGIDARAAIGDLGSLVIHDRSGAAVTAAEFPRLRPFIPQTTDDPATVKKKLNRFVSEYRALVEETTDFYKGSGYNVPDLMGPEGVKRGAPASGGFKIIGVK